MSNNNQQAGWQWVLDDEQRRQEEAGKAKANEDDQPARKVMARMTFDFDSTFIEGEA